MEQDLEKRGMSVRKEEENGGYQHRRSEKRITGFEEGERRKKQSGVQIFIHLSVFLAANGKSLHSARIENIFSTHLPINGNSKLLPYSYAWTGRITLSDVIFMRVCLKSLYCRPHTVSPTRTLMGS